MNYEDSQDRNAALYVDEVQKDCKLT